MVKGITIIERTKGLGPGEGAIRMEKRWMREMDEVGNSANYKWNQ